MTPTDPLIDAVLGSNISQDLQLRLVRALREVATLDSQCATLTNAIAALVHSLPSGEQLEFSKDDLEAIKGKRWTVKIQSDDGVRYMVEVES